MNNKMNNKWSRVGSCVTALAAFVAANAALAGPNLQPGLWEMTVTSSMPGMPVAPPPVTNRRCIDESDIIPQAEQPDQRCQDIQHEVDGDTVNWRIRCEQDGMTTVGDGRLTYAGDSYSGSMQLEMQGGPMGSMAMTQTLHGKRIGDCVQ